MSPKMARQGGTAGTVRPVPGVEYGHNGHRWVFVCRNRQNVIYHQATSHQSLKSEEAGY